MNLLCAAATGRHKRRRQARRRGPWRPLFHGLVRGQARQALRGPRSARRRRCFVSGDPGPAPFRSAAGRFFGSTASGPAPFGSAAGRGSAPFGSAAGRDAAIGLD